MIRHQTFFSDETPLQLKKVDSVRTFSPPKTLKRMPHYTPPKNLTRSRNTITRRKLHKGGKKRT